jgi:hypothetical protein
MTITDLSARRTTKSRPSLGLDALVALTRSIAARPELWRPKVRFDRDRRWWTRLDGPAGTDVWLLSWLQSQGTELHDHGDAAAAFTVVRGALTETRPDKHGQLVLRRIAAGQTQTVEPGVIHDVLNEHASRSVSIHAYSPRLAQMTYFAWSSGHALPTRTVQTDEPEEDQ